MTTMKRLEALDYDTWLWGVTAAGPDDDGPCDIYEEDPKNPPSCHCGYSPEEHEPDENEPDDADTDPEYGDF